MFSINGESKKLTHREKLIEALKKEAMTKTDIYVKVFGKNYKSKDINDLLEKLLSEGLIIKIQDKIGEKNIDHYVFQNT